MEALFSLIFAAVFIGIAVSKGKKQQARNASRQSPPPENPVQSPPAAAPPPVRPVVQTGQYRLRRDLKQVREKRQSMATLRMAMEDRSNDWLARQRREEARIARRGSLTDLGASHSANCDAGALKREHLLVHDDSVDTGEHQ